MKTQLTPCEEVLAIARGDERDHPEITAHLDRCVGCREEVSDYRLLAHAARTALMSASEAGALRGEAGSTLVRARRRPLFGGWALPAFAATAALMVLMLRAAPPSGAERLVLDITGIDAQVDSAASADPKMSGSQGLHWELTGSLGSASGDLPLAGETELVLETVAVNAMVLDTF